MSEVKFLYVYDPQLAKFLRYTKGIQFNCTGLNVKTKRQFFQFDKTDDLLSAFDEYEKLKIGKVLS